MGTVPVPTLSSTGWVNQPAEAADKLLSYFFLSDASQSQLYRGNVTALPSIIQRYGNDRNLIVRETERQLGDMLSRYFDSADVTADVDNPVAGDEGRMNLRIIVNLKLDGQTYSLGRLITSLNSTILKIAEINNDAVV